MKQVVHAELRCTCVCNKYHHSKFWLLLNSNVLVLICYSCIFSYECIYWLQYDLCNPSEFPSWLLVQCPWQRGYFIGSVFDIRRIRVVIKLSFHQKYTKKKEDIIKSRFSVINPDTWINVNTNQCINNHCSYGTNFHNISYAKKVHIAVIYLCIKRKIK